MFRRPRIRHAARPSLSPKEYCYANASTATAIAESYAHGKPVAVAEEAAALLKKAQVDASKGAEDGVNIGAAGAELDVLLQAFVKAIKQHRFFERKVESVPA